MVATVSVSHGQGTYNYRKPIFIDASKVSGTSDLQNFPVLVSLIDPDLATAAGKVTDPNGYDIIFRDSNGATNLDFEVERYDGATGTLIAWVRLPIVDYDDNTRFYMYYGNSNVSTSQQNVNGVWDTNYVGVWHLKETSGGAGAIKDSTSNVHHGTTNGTPNYAQTGQVGNAISFDGNPDYINVPSAADLEFSVAESFTVSAWIKGTFGGWWRGVVTKSRDSGSWYGIWVDDVTGAFCHCDGNPLLAGAVSAVAWQHVTIVYEAGAATPKRIYVDGNEANSDVYVTGHDGPDDLVFGRGSAASEWFVGAIDEVRISKMDRSPDWIKTSYNNQSSPSTFFVSGPEECVLDCPPLATSQGTGTITVTAPDYFEMTFSTATGGSIREFYDLALDSTRSFDLAGGVSRVEALYSDALEPGGLGFYNTDQNNIGAKLELLETTPTRVKVRQEAFYQEEDGVQILDGVKGIGDYSIYPSGRLALRWNRRTTQAVPYTNNEVDLVVHHRTAGQLSNWTGYTQGSAGPFPVSPGNQDFMLVQINQTDVKTDFLNIMYQDWAEADEVNWYPAGDPEEWGLALWHESDGPQIAAGASDIWNFLTYFKPTNFFNDSDPEVTGRSSDYRTPDGLSITTGSGWNENTADADFFNESEAAYTLDMNPSAGLRFSIDGSGTTRYLPFFKIRQWRSLRDPTSVEVDTVAKTNNVDYRADVKPIARAHFAQDLTWHSTVQDAASVDTNPDVGNPGTVGPNITGFAVGRYGNGVHIPADNEAYIEFLTVNLDLSRGAIEFWFKPDYDSTDGNDHSLGGYIYNGANKWGFVKDRFDNLTFTITDKASTSEIVVSPAQYSWRANDWVHLRFEWDDSLPVATQLKIFVNGVEPNPGGGTGSDYTAATWVSNGFRIGSRKADNDTSPGVYDEIHVYGGSSTTPSQVAYGGLTTNASEYLADVSDNFVLSFSTVDAERRGEYLYLGADSKFRGLNLQLYDKGEGSSPNLQWEYWNGSKWEDLENPVTCLCNFFDPTISLTETDGTIYWDADPDGWSEYSVNGGPDLYYVRAHLASGDYSTTFPRERQIKTDILLFQYCADITSNAEFVFGLPLATAVEMVRFEAEGLDKEVILLWETGSEVNNLGFHLYRSTAEEGPYTRITSRPIPGLGSSPEGATYSYHDKGLENSVAYYYKLEDIDTNGKTEMHGPLWATPEAGAGPCCDSGDRDPEESRITVGEPMSSELRVIEERPGEVVLELWTGGFFAVPREDGTVELETPGYSRTTEKGLPALPVRRTWVEAIAGRDVRLVSIESFEEEWFEGLHPWQGEADEVEVTPGGSVRLRQSDSARSSRTRQVRAVVPGFYPITSAQVLSVGYQGDVKKALVELAPLHWDAGKERLTLTHRLVVRLSFRGRDVSDRAVKGRRGRRYRKRASHDERRVVARLVTKERGLYAARFEDVMPGSSSKYRADSLKLSRQGEAVAFHLRPQSGWYGPGVTLYFVSEGAAANPYGHEAVYELEVGVTGETMPVKTASPSGPVTEYYWEVAEREENRLYQAVLVEAPDPWLWSALFAPARQSFGLEVSALAPAADSPRLEVWLQGTSDFAADPDHHVRLWVNEILVGETSWDGKRAQKIDTELPAGVLQEGENRLEIENVGDTEATYSMIMLDRYRLSYPRRPQAVKGTLEGTWGQSGTARVAGLSPQSYALEMSANGPLWLDEAEPTANGLRFRVEANGRYLAVSPESVREVEVRKPPTSKLKKRGFRGDYIVLGPRGFLNAASGLMEHRRSQGLHVLGVAVEDVYSEFGYGEETPMAIEDFLSYAYHHWSVAPRYVVFLGDGTYDFKDWLGTGVENQVPPLMVKTSYLWTASDPTYAAVNGDDRLPDLAVGRLPAASVEELRRMIDKIVTWETSGSSLEGRVILVADNPDEAGNFVSNGEELAARVLRTEELKKIYLSELGTASTRQEIQGTFNEGSSLMSYIGHGGIHLWADENILNIWDVENFAAQTQQPLLLTMNCLNGYFQFPYFNSLAEELLKAEDKGVIAAFSPSGLSVNDAAHVLHRALLDELLHGDHRRLGDAVLAAQETYADSGALPEMLLIYHLFGDPAMKIN